MSWLRDGWATWVAIWDQREHPRSLAAIRIALGLVVLWDLLSVARLDLVRPLFALEGQGGLSATLRAPMPAPWSLVVPESLSVWGLYGGLVACAALFTVGLLTRPAMLAFVLLSAQWEWILPEASRGIESAIRIVLLILAFSASDHWLSLASWRRTGSIWGNGALVPAWPRHLVLSQLILMYFLAGIQKLGLAWSPMHHFSALYLILQDSAVANARYDWVIGQPWYTFTQVGTAVTMAWEWTAPLLVLVYWWRFTPERPGRLRAWSNRYRLDLIWASVGVVFHVGIALLLELGIFPAAMLSFYFAFAHPDELAALGARLTGGAHASASRGAAPG